MKREATHFATLGSSPRQAILQTMGPLRRLLTVVVVVVVIRWLWNSSTIEQSKFEAGRQLFPPTRAMCILTIFGGVVFTALFVWSQLSLRQPSEWWAPYLFLGFVALRAGSGKHLVSIRLQIRGSSATEESVTLTKQMKIDQCERVRMN